MFSVLIVDDEVLMLETLQNHINWHKLGFKVVGSAKNGKKALELVKECSPDIVITDIRMPIMDGIELSKILRKTNPEIKILFLTGYEEFSYAKEALQLGVTDYILKPICIKDFNELMRKVYHECLTEKRNIEEFLELTKKQLAPFLNKDELYNDIIIEGNNEFLKQIDVFFKLAENINIELKTIKSIIGEVLTQIYNADDSYGGFLHSPQEIQTTIEKLDTSHKIRSYFHEVINKIECFYKKQLQDPNVKITNDMKKFIDQNYSKQLTVEDVANSVHYSPGYARNLFKKITGTTITDYIKTVRIEVAKELLKERKYKVYDVANKVGYDNISYFCSVFKEYTGLTPNDYKKRF